MEWPFQRKLKQVTVGFWIAKSYPGILRQADGSLEISLTNEELEAVQGHLDMMNAVAKEQTGGADVLVHPEAAKVLEAQGLWSHARHILVRSRPAVSGILNEGDSQKAIAALTKAYALCCFPIILADLADTFKMSGDQEMEARLDREFSERREQFQHCQLYSMFLEWRNGILGRQLAKDRRK